MRARRVAMLFPTVLSGCLGGPIFGSAGADGDTDTDTNDAGSDSWGPSTSGQTTTAGTGAVLDVGGGNTSNDQKFDIGDPPTYPGQLHIMLGQDDGTYASELEEAISDQPTSLALTDLNGDGRDEILIGSWHGDLTIAGFTGDGPLAVAELATPPAFDLLPTDFDLDGDADVLAFGWFSGQVTLLSGSGAGALSMSDLPVPLEDSLPVRGQMVDLDGDSDLDLVVLGTGRDECYSEGVVEVAILLRGPGGDFTPFMHPVGLGQGRGQLAVADLDGDMLPDVVAGAHGRELHLLRGLGAGDLDVSQPIPGIPDIRAGVLVREATGDGVLDLLVATQLDGVPGGALQVFPGIGDGGFGAPESELTTFFMRDLIEEDAGNLLGVGSDWVVRLSAKPPDTLWQASPAGVWTRAARGDVNGDGVTDLVLLGGETIYAGVDGTARLGVPGASCPPPG